MLTRREMMLVALAGCATGCTSSSDSAGTASHDGSHFLLDDEPTGAIGVAEAKEALADSAEVVLIGRIQGGESEPWSKGRAAFFVSEASAMLEIDEDDHDHGGEGHDPKTCPFCNRNKNSADSQAIVQFLDDQGEVLKVDARKLLPVEEGQLVVVKGRGQLDDLGTLVIAAKGIYLRQ